MKSSYNNDMVNNDFPKIRLIVFDIDGTLAETDDYFVEKAVIFQKKIMPFIKSETAEIVIRPLIMFGETVLHSFYRLLDWMGLDTVISRAHSKVSVNSEYKYREVEGIRDTLVLLSAYYPLGIISSGGRKSTLAFIRKFELQDMVSYVISAEDCRFIKPHPMPLLKIAELAGVPIESCLMVGDTVFDILCAKRAGAFSAAVKTGFDTVRFLKLFHADLMLESVNDLPGIILSGEKKKKPEETDGKRKAENDEKEEEESKR